MVSHPRYSVVKGQLNQYITEFNNRFSEKNSDINIDFLNTIIVSINITTTIKITITVYVEKQGSGPLFK